MMFSLMFVSLKVTSRCLSFSGIALPSLVHLTMLSGGGLSRTVLAIWDASVVSFWFNWLYLLFKCGIKTKKNLNGFFDADLHSVS